MKRILNWIKQGKKQCVICWRGSHEVYEKGYIDTRTVFTQRFNIHRKWYFIPLTPKPIFYEEIPIWAMAGLSCCGYTDWKSDAPQWMHDLNKKREWMSPEELKKYMRSKNEVTN